MTRKHKQSAESCGQSLRYSDRRKHGQSTSRDVAKVRQHDDAERSLRPPAVEMRRGPETPQVKLSLKEHRTPQSRLSESRQIERPFLRCVRVTQPRVAFSRQKTRCIAFAVESCPAVVGPGRRGRDSEYGLSIYRVYGE